MGRDSGGFKLIKAARMIDGTGRPPLERGAVLVEDGAIRAVGTEEAVAPPEGAPVQEYDYGDATILPGLVDCHVHLIGIGDGRRGDDLTTLPDEVLTLQAAHNAREHLYSGVTTVRDCGAKNRTVFMLRQAVEMGVTPSPRLVLAGRPLAIIGGHLSYFGIQATGPVECTAAVRQLIKEGSDFIKITASGGSTATSFPLLPSFNLDELTAICNEAHKFGKHTAAHCTNSQAMVNALDAGVDTLIHGRQVEPDGSIVYRPEITERIVERGVFLNPTLAQGKVGMDRLAAKKESVGLSDAEETELDRLKGHYYDTTEHFARVRAEGVRLVCGSDSAWAYYPMGNFQAEVEAHVEVGMSPMEAIVSATSDSAKSCRIDDTVGTLAAGKAADVLIVDGDPSKDIKALRNVSDVFLGGGRVDRGNYV